MAGESTLEGKNGELALTMLKKVTNILDDNNIDYWLEGGTLLGVIRENRLLPWDNDLDISMKEEELPKLEKVLKKIPYKVRVRKFTRNTNPFNRGDTRMIKISNKRLFFFQGDITLDIFVKYKKDETYYWKVGSKGKSVPAHFYKDITDYPFAGKDFKIPKDYAAYLTYRYGDWKIPVKVWDTFADDKAINKDVG